MRDARLTKPTAPTFAAIAAMAGDRCGSRGGRQP